MSKQNDPSFDEVVLFNDEQEDGQLPLVKMVYDKEDKKVRLDFCGDMNKGSTTHPRPPIDLHHVLVNRKQALKMIKMLEDYIFWNNK